MGSDAECVGSAISSRACCEESRYSNGCRRERGSEMKAKSPEDLTTLYPFVGVAMLLLGLVGVVQRQLIMPHIPAVLSVLFEGVGVGFIGAGVGYFVLRIVRPTREQF